MQEGEASRRIDFAKLFYGAMVLVGIYAVLRYGGAWAYALGKFVGSN